MGAISQLKTTISRLTRRSVQGSEPQRLRQSAARYYDKSTSSLTDEEFASYLRARNIGDFNDIPVRATGSAAKWLALPAGVAIGGGAWAYGTAEDARASRYAAYQAELDEIDRLEASGEISATEAAERRERARNDYRRAEGDETAGITWAELLADMSTVQLGISAAVLIAVAMYLGPPALDALDGFNLAQWSAGDMNAKQLAVPVAGLLVIGGVFYFGSARGIGQAGADAAESAENKATGLALDNIVPDLGLPSFELPEVL